MLLRELGALQLYCTRSCAPKGAGRTTIILYSELCSYGSWAHYSYIVLGGVLLRELGALQLYCTPSCAPKSVIPTIFCGLQNSVFALKMLKMMGSPNHLLRHWQLNIQNWIQNIPNKLRNDEFLQREAIQESISNLQIDPIIVTGSIKQTFETRRFGRVGETGSPAHSDGIAICRSSNA